MNPLISTIDLCTILIILLLDSGQVFHLLYSHRSGGKHVHAQIGELIAKFYFLPNIQVALTHAFKTRPPFETNVEYN